MKVTILRQETIDLNLGDAAQIFEQHLHYVCGGSDAYINKKGELVVWFPDRHGSGGEEVLKSAIPSKVVLAAHALRDELHEERMKAQQEINTAPKKSSRPAKK